MRASCAYHVRPSWRLPLFWWSIPGLRLASISNHRKSAQSGALPLNNLDYSGGMPRGERSFAGGSSANLFREELPRSGKGKLVLDAPSFFSLQRSAQGDAQRSEHRPRQVPRCFAPCSSDRLLRASGPALKASSAERCNLGKPVGRSDCALGRRPVRGRMPDRWPCRSIFFLGLFWVVGVSPARCAVSTRAPVSASLVHVCS